MWRVCGADSVRTWKQQKVCWCRGIFCGPGGARESEKFWRDMRQRRIAHSANEFCDMCHQADLFDDTSIVDGWRERVFERWEPKPEPRKRTKKAIAQPGDVKAPIHLVKTG